MSENNSNNNLDNNNNNINSEISASQPVPEVFSDATNRFLNNIESPQKVYSASQPEPSAAAGILKRGRKSFGNGRRVSFAATAHVRVFGNEEKGPAGEAEERERIRKAQAAAEEEEAEEQRQLEEFRKQFSNENGQVEELKNSLNEFEIKSSPAREASVDSSSITPLKRPFITTVDQSFDGNVYNLDFITKFML